MFGNGQVFVLSDPVRNPNLNEIITNSPKDALIIYRNYGAPIPKLKKQSKKQILASVSPKQAFKHKLLGIHIPNKSLKHHHLSKAKGLMTTGSAHNLREITRAINCGIENVIISAIFQSKSKSAGKPKGNIKLAQLIRLFPKQKFIALGGINHKSLKRLKGIKLKGIAGVSFN